MRRLFHRNVYKYTKPVENNINTLKR